MKSLPHIGTIELVSLPDDGIQGVPAKIDTGADSSAIWATQITEKENALSFVLFDKNSPFYTGKVLTSRNYQVISVKNSFGKSELRYKVSLKITVAGRTIRARFTLANRKNNKYHVLIGRRTIQGKFLVDVARKPAKPELQILILSTKLTDITGKFAKNLERYGENLRVTYASYQDLVFVTGNGSNQITLQKSGRDISSFDLVHFKTTTQLQDVAAAIANYLGQRNVPFLDLAIKNFPSTSKLYQYIILADNEISLPLSIFMLPGPMKMSYSTLKDQLGLPFIFKDVHGKRGNFNFLINDKKSFLAACEQVAQHNVMCIAQTYIANEGDYRVLVFGTKIALVIKRTAKGKDTHLNNTSQGANAILVPTRSLPPRAQTTCITAAKLLQRQVAGVDIVKDKTTNVWYCLEVNDGPQLATGSFTDEKQTAFAAYLERKLAR